MVRVPDPAEGEPPGMPKGALGPLLELYFVIFGPSKSCPECGSSWRGYYSQHMKYCHFCGVELIQS